MKYDTMTFLLLKMKIIKLSVIIFLSFLFFKLVRESTVLSLPALNKLIEKMGVSNLFLRLLKLINA
jgi:hypothetical protein